MQCARTDVSARKRVSEFVFSCRRLEVTLFGGEPLSAIAVNDAIHNLPGLGDIGEKGRLVLSDTDAPLAARCQHYSRNCANTQPLMWTKTILRVRHDRYALAGPAIRD